MLNWRHKTGQECRGHKTGQEYHGHKTAGNEECQNIGIKIKWDKNANWRHKTGQESIAKGTKQKTGIKWDKNAKLKAQNRTGMPQERIAKGTQQDKSPTPRVRHRHRAWREVIVCKWFTPTTSQGPYLGISSCAVKWVLVKVIHSKLYPCAKVSSVRSPHMHSETQAVCKVWVKAYKLYNH